MNKLSMLWCVVTLAGCALVEPSGSRVPTKVNPIRVGVYVGEGAQANGVCHWQALTTLSPDLEPTFVDARTIADGALKGVDMLVMPGGSSYTEFDFLKTNGADRIVKDFIRAGGGYVGTCAGNCIILNERRRLRLAPYERHASSGRHGTGLLAMKFNARAEELCGIKASTRNVRYSGGPIMKPGKPVEGAKFETVAVYDCDLVCEYGTNASEIVSMKGCPAAIAGTYGKGRVFAFATHPEYRADTLDLLAGAFRYVTGRKVRFVRPQRRRGDLCVAVYAPGMCGREDAGMIAKLVATPGLDVSFVNQKEEIGVGSFDHADVVVLPGGNAQIYRKKFSSETKAFLARFLSRGGVIMAYGAGAKRAPEGARRLATADELVAELCDLRGKPPICAGDGDATRSAPVSSRYRTPGIIGGMGPSATCDLMQKIIDNTDAQDDQHNVHVLVDQNTDVPDRTAAILKGGADPVPELTRSARRLEAAGADFLCMSCNTAHYFHGDVAKAVSIPVLNMPAESAKELKRRGVRKIGLLATDGTIKTGVYHRFLKAEGIEVVVPEGENQATVMRLIYDCVKKGVPTKDYPAAAVAKTLADLRTRGAEAFLLACTELPIAFERLGYKDGFVDPTLVLARAVVREAGAPLK